MHPTCHRTHILSAAHRPLEEDFLASSFLGVQRTFSCGSQFCALVLPVWWALGFLTSAYEQPQDPTLLVDTDLHKRP